MENCQGLDPGVFQWEVGGPWQYREREGAVQLPQGRQDPLQTSDAPDTAGDQDRAWVARLLLKLPEWIHSDLFRTNNTTILEEKNIQLFIQKSEEFLKITKIFDSKDYKVFRKFENSWIVLNAIVKLSRHSSTHLKKTEVSKLEFRKPSMLAT